MEYDLFLFCARITWGGYAYQAVAGGMAGGVVVGYLASDSSLGFRVLIRTWRAFDGFLGSASLKTFVAQ